MKQSLSVMLVGWVVVAWSSRIEAANKITNGDFTGGLSEWTPWIVRDGNTDFTAVVTAGELSISGTDIEGGVYQQFYTGGAGDVVTVTGHWRSDPTLADAMWAEVWVINATRVPADGVAEVDGANDALLLYRNDAFLGRGAWDNAIPKSALVNYEVSFTAAGPSATLILVTGNTGPATLTGTKFDDLDVRSVPPPATVAALPDGFESRSHTFASGRLVSLAQSPVSHHLYAISNNQDSGNPTNLYRVNVDGPAITSTLIPITGCGGAITINEVQAITFDGYGDLYVSTRVGDIYKGRDGDADPAIDDFCFDQILDLPEFQIGTFHGVGGVAVGADDMLYINSGSESHYGYLSNGSLEVFAGRYNSRILRCSLEGGIETVETFCEGIRNSFDIAFRADGKLFGVENGPNLECDYAEEFNLLEQGNHYGFPYKYGSDLSGSDSSITCTSVGPTGPPPLPGGIAPTPAWANYGPDATPDSGELGYADGREYYGFEPHRSPDGLSFYEPTRMDPEAVLFPEEFHGRAFVAHFGQLEPIAPVGHDVTSLRLDDAHNAFTCNTFLEQLDRPIDVLCAYNGKLYVLGFTFGGGSPLYEIGYTVPLGPLILLDRTTIDRAADFTENLTDDTFEVSNGGIGTVDYTIVDDADWLSVAPDSGTSTGEADPITVSYDVGGLPIGVHAATITITDPGASNSPRTIDVMVTVKTVLPDFDQDGDVDQADFGEMQRCYSGPGVAAAPGCEPADLDGDLDVDQDDGGILQGCHSGELQLADKTCDDAYE